MVNVLPSQLVFPKKERKALKKKSPQFLFFKFCLLIAQNDTWNAESLSDLEYAAAAATGLEPAVTLQADCPAGGKTMDHTEKLDAFGFGSSMESLAVPSLGWVHKRLLIYRPLNCFG